MGAILIKQWKGGIDKRISITLSGRVIGELAYLENCIRR